MVEEEFQIKVLTLESGFDPDLYIRRKGKDAYAEALRNSQRYFSYLIERARSQFPARIPNKAGKRREILVRGLASRSLPRAAARLLYEDVTPPVAAEVREARRLDRMLAPKVDEGRPDKRDRREIIRRKRR